MYDKDVIKNVFNETMLKILKKLFDEKKINSDILFKMLEAIVFLNMGT